MAPTFALKKYILLYCLVVFLLNLLQAYQTPIVDDEAYYWNWAQQLDFGYFDHPPMIALWIKFGFSWIQNNLGLRLFTALFASFWIYLLSKIVQPKNKQEFFLFIGLCSAVVLFQLYQFIATPDAPLLTFSVCFWFALKSYFNKKNWTHSLLLGICIALLLYAKYHAVLLIGFAFFPHLRKESKEIKTYFALLLAIVLYIPHLVWQAQHNWISFRYHLFSRQQEFNFTIQYMAEYLLLLLVVFSPFLMYHFAKASIKYVAKSSFEVSLKWVFFGVIGFFFVSSIFRRVQPQWLLIALVPLFILGFEYYKTKKSTHKTLLTLSFLGASLLLLGRVYFLLPNPPIQSSFHGAKQFMKNLGALNGSVVLEKYQTVSLYNYYNYPNKSAGIYRTLANRESQYSLWNTEQKLSKDFYYVSKYVKAWPDSLVWQQHKPVAYHYKKIANFVPIHQLSLEVQSIHQKKDSVYLTVLATNQHNYPVSIGKKTRNPLFAIHGIGNHKYNHRQALLLDSTLLESNESKILTMQYLNTKEKGTHKAYIGVVPKPLSLKKISNWFEVVN